MFVLHKLIKKVYDLGKSQQNWDCQRKHNVEGFKGGLVFKSRN